MNSRRRLLAAIDGQPVDRVPYTAWHHFYLDPPAGRGSAMADAELGFFNAFQPDLLKVMHDVPYEPIGSLLRPIDWVHIPVLDPECGNFGLQLETLAQIRERLDPDVPMIDTVFGVYHYADKLSEGRLLEQLRWEPDLVHAGLRSIAESLAAYALATIDAGCEGIYYALSGASGEGASRDEYAEHFLPYDRQILEAVMAAPFSILHLHGYKDLYFDLTHDLPAAAVCWSDRSGGPSLVDARKLHTGCLMGGLDETTFGSMSAEQIAAQGQQAIKSMNGKSFILSPGCSVPQDTRAERLQAIRAAVCTP